MACLLEQVVDLPAILWRYDQYELALQTRSKPPNELNAQLRRLWTSIREFEARLRGWKHNWVDNDPSRQIFEVRWQGAEPFPIFQYTDSTTLDIITPPTICTQPHSLRMPFVFITQSC